jgi:hypothetical protein
MWCFDLTNVVLFGFRFIRKSTSYYIISLYSPDFVSYLYTHLTLYHISILTWLYIISLYSPDFISYRYTHLTLCHISILTWLHIISLYSPDFISYLCIHPTLYHIFILTWLYIISLYSPDFISLVPFLFWHLLHFTICACCLRFIKSIAIINPIIKIRNITPWMPLSVGRSSITYVYVCKNLW